MGEEYHSLIPVPGVCSRPNHRFCKKHTISVKNNNGRKNKMLRLLFDIIIISGSLYEYYFSYGLYQLTGREQKFPYRGLRLKR